jgi:photosystem II stability/assembly factor-like uncharacterized protein
MLRSTRLLGLLVVTTCLTTHAQWEIQNSTSTADLRGIDSVGGGVAWASGSNGTVLRTEDGGYMWQSCSMPPGAEHLDFRGIQAFDANTAIVMSSGKGDLSRLYKTIDGCHTWKLIFTNPDKDGFWDALAAGGKTVFILGDPVNDFFVLEESHDSGATWRRDSLPASPPDEGAFAASNSSLLIDSANGVILFGTGGPKGSRIFLSRAPCSSSVDKDCWSTHAMPMFGAGAPVGIFSLAANRIELADKFVAVGGDYSKLDQAGSAAFTSDKHLAGWTTSQTPPHGYRSAVAYDEKSKTWITVGPNGTDISTDDGRNWRALHPDPSLHEPADADRNWNALSLPYVVGPHGRIGKLRPQSLAHK